MLQTKIFERYIGIDYSGAETPTSSLKGLRVYSAEQESQPSEVQPPPSPRKYWTRRGIAEWLVEQLKKIKQAAVELGCHAPEPFMSLSFLALPVVPELKLTDRGLVDVNRFEIVPLFVDPG